MKNLKIFFVVLMLLTFVGTLALIHTKFTHKPLLLTGPTITSPLPEPKPKPEPKPEPKVDERLAKLVAAHNEIRKSHGLPTLVTDGSLMRIAQEWAEHMAKTGIMRHQSLKFGKGWGALGENIAMGQKGVEEVMKDWMKSPGHRANILKPIYTNIGVGVAEGKQGRLYWCTDFGRKAGEGEKCIEVIEELPPVIADGVK